MSKRLGLALLAISCKEIAPYTSAKMVTELKIVKCDNILSIDGSVLHTHVAEPMTTGISA